MVPDRSERLRVNIEKSFALASVLFPLEQWIPTEANIWVAKSRLSVRYLEPDKWKREMTQVRILTDRGSVAFFLPENDRKGEPGKRYPDMVLDGTVLEIKTVSGKIKTLGLEFKRGYKQGKSLLEANLPAHYFSLEHSVFIYLISDLNMAKNTRPLRGRGNGERGYNAASSSGDPLTGTIKI